MQEKYARIASRILGADIEQYVVDQMGTPAVDINNPCCQIPHQVLPLIQNRAQLINFEMQ